VLGKFSLAFSMAPEFYRRVYHKNPTKLFGIGVGIENSEISETSWKEIIALNVSLSTITFNFSKWILVRLEFFFNLFYTRLKNLFYKHFIF